MSCANAGAKGGDGTYGDWAVCEPTVNTYQGGTWFLATTLTKHPEACGEMIRYFTLNATKEGNMYWWVTDKGDISSSAAVNGMIIPDFSLDFCAGQNTLAVQDAVAKNIKKPLTTQYDGLVEEIIIDEASSYADGEKNLQEAIDSMIQRVGEQVECELPTVVVTE